MMKKILSYIKHNEKKSAVTAVAVILLISVSIPAAAWFTSHRRIVTVTKIQTPAALNIGAGNRESCAYIDLAGIDVTSETSYKEFVFSVYSETNIGESYDLQLAHTTNIPFTYEIYRAKQVNENTQNSLMYHSSEDGNDYYYSYLPENEQTVKVEGSYINQNGSVADDSQHSLTYGEYTNVQTNAEPLYWRNSTPISVKDWIDSGDESKGFTDYFILKVSWDSNSVLNNKETDMIYITAGMSS